MICEICGKPKSIELPTGQVVKCACDCDVKEITNQEKIRIDREKELRIKANKKSCFDNPSMLEKTFDKDDKKGGEEITIAKRYAEQFPMGSDGLVFYGDTDKGKTFASACIANYLLDKGYSVLFRSVPKIVYDAQRNGFEDWLSKYIECDLLIIDDLGAERTTGFAQEAIYNVVNDRNAARKPIVATSNLSIKDLSSAPSMALKRIYNRILEQCLPIHVENGRTRANKETYSRIKKNLGIQ